MSPINHRNLNSLVKSLFRLGKKTKTSRQTISVKWFAHVADTNEVKPDNAYITISFGGNRLIFLFKIQI